MGFLPVRQKRPLATMKTASGCLKIFHQSRIFRYRLGLRCRRLNGIGRLTMKRVGIHARNPCLEQEEQSGPQHTISHVVSGYREATTKETMLQLKCALSTLQRSLSGISRRKSARRVHTTESCARVYALNSSTRRGNRATIGSSFLVWSGTRASLAIRTQK